MSNEPAQTPLDNNLGTHFPNRYMADYEQYYYNNDYKSINKMLLYMYKIT